MADERGPAPEWATDSIGVIDAAGSSCKATIPEDMYDGMCATVALTEAMDDENDRIKLLMIVMGKLWKAGHAAGQSAKDEPRK